MLVVALAALTLAALLGACGGSSSDGSKSPAAASNAGATGATSATGASGATGAAGARTTPRTRKKHPSGGASAPTRTADAGGDTAASPAAPPSGTGTQGGKPARKRTTTKKDKAKKPKFPPGSFEGQASEMYGQSKYVCNYLTLQGLAHEYEVQPVTPDAVARKYASYFPTNVRDAVYRGCIAGLTS